MLFLPSAVSDSFPGSMGRLPVFPFSFFLPVLEAVLVFPFLSFFLVFLKDSHHPDL